MKLSLEAQFLIIINAILLALIVILALNLIRRRGARESEKSLIPLSTRLST